MDSEVRKRTDPARLASVARTRFEPARMHPAARRAGATAPVDREELPGAASAVNAGRLRLDVSDAIDVVARLRFCPPTRGFSAAETASLNWALDVLAAATQGTPRPRLRPSLPDLPNGATTMTDPNCLSTWFPLVQQAGLPVPDTHIVHATSDLSCLLDGRTPEGWEQFVRQLAAAGDRVGWPCFLRTGHGSGKHEWATTCRVPAALDIEQNVAALVEWSHVVDVMGLPTGVWAVRRMLDIAPLFHCVGYRGLPIAREFRLFASPDGVEHIQPYWPATAIERGRPDLPAATWRSKLQQASTLTAGERALLGGYAQRAAAALGGGSWSVDFIIDRSSQWWLIDIAEAARSFRWDGGSDSGAETDAAEIMRLVARGEEPAARERYRDTAVDEALKGDLESDGYDFGAVCQEANGYEPRRVTPHKHSDGAEEPQPPSGQHPEH